MRPRTIHLSNVGRGWKKNEIYSSYCKFNNHRIYKYQKFIGLPTTERFKFVRSNNLCVNCLGTKHKIENCKSKNCFICSGLHYTLLHTFTEKASSSNRQNINQNRGSS